MSADDLRACAAHQPGDRRRAVGVLDDDHLGVELTGLTVERLHLLALARAAHDQLRAGDAVEIEGVQRLAAEQHRVVGDVDDVVDRALPGGHQTRLQPCRGRTDRDVVEDARREARTQLRALHDDLRARHRTLRSGVGRPRRVGQRCAGRGVQLARDAVNAEAVGAVGCDLQLEHVLGDHQHVGQRRARRKLRVERHLVEHHDSLTPGADLQLVLGEDHPFGDDAAQLRALELGAVGQHRAGQRHGNRLTGGDVRRAADDRRRPVAVAGALAEVDLAHAQAIGVRVRLDVEHAPDDEAACIGHAVVVNRLDLRAGHRQALLDLAHAQRRIAVFAQPCQRDAHQNWSKKRRSFS